MKCEGQHESPMEMQERAKAAMAAIPHKILVMSGKGGVGKTSVAVNLAHALAERGRVVGLLDVDLHGPNAPLMCGLEGQRAEVKDERVIPVVSPGGVHVISMSFFLEDSSDAVIWRGPLKMGAIAQFMADVDWSGVDTLVVDTPPGTGDEPLSVAQLLGTDFDGAIIVTSPQDVSLMDSTRSVSFARKLSVPILGIVENMSGLICPHCGETVNLFKSGGGEKTAVKLDVPFLGRIPLSPAMVEACDAGKPIVLAAPKDPASQAFLEIAEKLLLVEQ
jgi:ATP-binding protein involved in chromosome partitioning